MSGMADEIRTIVREEIRAALADLRTALTEQPRSPAADPLLTVAEVAARVGHVEPETVREWIHSGKLVATRPGGRRYAVSPDDLARFLANRSDQGGKISEGEHLRLLSERIERATGT